MSTLSKESFSIEVGKRIKKQRESKGVSQEELAHKCELYRTYIGHLENGRYSPSAYILYKISKALSIDLKALLP